MSASEVIGGVPVEKLVKAYIKISGARSALKSKYEQEDEALKTQMDSIKRALLDYCKEQGVESVKTSEGLFYRTVKTTYWTNDWEAMGRFVVDNNIPELFEKRLHQGNVKQYLEEHPEQLPPGLNVENAYVVTVRRNK